MCTLMLLGNTVYWWALLEYCDQCILEIKTESLFAELGVCEEIWVFMNVLMPNGANNRLVEILINAFLK